MAWAARLARLPSWLGLRPRPPAAVLAVAALISLAWSVLLLGLVSMPMASGATPAMAAGPLWICGVPGGAMSMGGGAMGGSGGAASPLQMAAEGMPMWSLMALAMMLPAALPATSHVALNSLQRRRGRAVSEFLVAYLLPWLAFGGLALLLLALLPGQATVMLAAALAIATLWELSPAKRWALNRCHRTSPLPPSGWRASLGATRFGVLHGGACVVSCWPLMLVMAAAPSARLAWCAGLGGVSLAEKLAQRPRRSARRVGMALGLGFVAAALAALSAGV